jgi:hypothetical protein
MYDFKKSMIIGKQAEKYAEQYFIKNKWQYKDVRNIKEYQIIDVDYLVNNEKWEVKKNIHNALYGKKGYYFWIEISIDNDINRAWWYFNKTDFFFFISEEKSIIIENNILFINYINELILNGDHSKEGANRIDIIKDKRKDGYIEAKNLRVYLENIPSDIKITNIINRRKI